MKYLSNRDASNARAARKKKEVTSGPRCMLNRRGIVKSKKMVE
jgi:hypothetical protein